MKEPSSPLHLPEYRLFWLARCMLTLATTGMIVIMGYQLYDLARSVYGMSIAHASFQLGILGLVQFLPMLLLTPVAGLMADRYDRRTVTMAAIATDLLVILALAATTYQDALSLPLLFALGAAHGMARVFTAPAMSAIAPNIVPPALLPKAIALNSIAWQSGTVAGPAAAGLLYASNASMPYWLAAILAGLSLLAMLGIRRLPPPEGNRREPPLSLMAGGARFVWNDRFLLGCISLDLFAVLLGGATALLPVYARDILHVGPEGLGQMRAAPAVGAALVALWLSFRPTAHNVGAKMLWAVAIFGAATAVFGISRNFALSLALLALLGAADMVSVFIRSSLVQLNTPDDKRGRVQSISSLAISASNELGEMQSGFAAALLGATGAVVFGGVGAIVITGLWAIVFPELRKARTFAPQFHQKEHDT